MHKSNPDVRRSEVIRLRWSDLERNDDNKLQVTFKVKGGDYIAEEVSDTCWTTLVNYLRASDRLYTPSKFLHASYTLVCSAD